MRREDIESVRVTKYKKDKIRGFCTAKFKNGLVLSGLKVLSGSKGLFVGMPSVLKKRDGQDSWENLAYFPDEEDRRVFNEIILEQYEKEVAKDNPASEKSSDINTSLTDMIF